MHCRLQCLVDGRRQWCHRGNGELQVAPPVYWDLHVQSTALAGMRFLVVVAALASSWMSAVATTLPLLVDRLSGCYDTAEPTCFFPLFNESTVEQIYTEYCLTLILL